MKSKDIRSVCKEEFLYKEYNSLINWNIGPVPTQREEAVCFEDFLLAKKFIEWRLNQGANIIFENII